MYLCISNGKQFLPTKCQDLLSSEPTGRRDEGVGRHLIPLLWVKVKLLFKRLAFTPGGRPQLADHRCRVRPPIFDEARNHR